MISPRKRGIAASIALLVVWVLTSARSARADLAGSVAPRGVIPLRIEYVAPAVCPSSELFYGQIRERAPDVHLVPDNEVATIVKVRVVSAPPAAADPFHAQLVLEAQAEQAPTPERTERVVTGASCADVVRAVAFVVATFVVERASHADTASEVRVRSPSPSAPSTPPEEVRVLPIPRARRYSALLASVGARTGIGTMKGPTVGIAFERFVEGSWLAPSVRPSLAFGVTGRTLAPDTITVRLFTAAVDGCAFGLGRLDRRRGRAIAPRRLDRQLHRDALQSRRNSRRAAHRRDEGVVLLGDDPFCGWGPRLHRRARDVKRIDRLRMNVVQRGPERLPDALPLRRELA